MVPELKILVTGKRVAVVGNAQSLNKTEYGEEIDSHDVVIRINNPANFYIGHPEFDGEDYDLEKAVGTKMDVWAMWDSTNYISYVNKLPKLGQEAFNKDGGVKIPILCLGLGRRWHGFFWVPAGNPWNKPTVRASQAKDPKEVVEKYKKDYAHEIRFKGEMCGFFQNPSSGLTVLKLLDRCMRKGFERDSPKVGRMSIGYISELNIYGFDFKETPTFSKPNEKITDTPSGERVCYFGHKFMREQTEVMRLCEENGWNLKK